MARILVQTNDCRTVFDERDVSLIEINGKGSRSGLVDRIGRAIREADTQPTGRRPALRHVLAIVPVKGYLELNG